MTDWFVSPSGNSLAHGTQADPWDIISALGNTSGKIQPGDTVWALAGIYKPIDSNGFKSSFGATADKPIVVRAYKTPGKVLHDRVTLDCRGSEIGQMMYGGYTWMWNIELMDSNATRQGTVPGSAGQTNAFGVGMYAPGMRWINGYVHDTAEGFSCYDASPDSEIYGCISMYNGWMGPDRNHGHGMYGQNVSGTKLWRDNFVGDNADEGLQVYGSGRANVTGFTVQGNTLWNTSSWPFPHFQYNLVMGGGALQTGNKIWDNNSWFDLKIRYGFINIGQYTASSNLDVQRNNWIGGAVTLAVEGVDSPLVMLDQQLVNVATDPGTGFPTQMLKFGQFSGQSRSGYQWDRTKVYGPLNVIYAIGTYGPDAVGNSVEAGGTNMPFASWQDLTGFDVNGIYLPTLPAGKWIYVRPNLYETKRANITVYNWDALDASGNPVTGKSPNVNVDIGKILSIGDPYEIHDAQNFWGAPVAASASYDGQPITIPMEGLTKATPVGFAAPTHTAPAFGTFIVIGGNAGDIPQTLPPPGSQPPPPPPPPPSDTGFTVGQSVEVKPNLTSNLNVRSTPDPTATPIGAEAPSKIGVVSKDPNGNFTATGGGFTFYYVAFADVTGWVVADYLVPSGTPAPPPSTLEPPTMLSATAAKIVILTWMLSANPGIGTNIYRSTSSGGPYAKVNALGPVPGSGFQDGTVTAGNRYFYVVRAVDATGKESGNSNEASATVPVVTPPPITAPTIVQPIAVTLATNTALITFSDGSSETVSVKIVSVPPPPPPPPPPTGGQLAVPPSLTGAIGKPFSVQLIIGGTPPYSIRPLGGTFPPSWNITAAGVLTCDTSSAFVNNFEFLVTDSAGASLDATVSLTIR